MLAQLRAGEEGAAEALFSLLYDELHALARNQMRRERPGHTLQTTALIHEAFLRLGGGQELPWEDKAHFMKSAARAMRRILIDHARSKRAARRGGRRERRPLDVEGGPRVEEHPLDLLALDEALEQLASLDPRLVEVVELRFFGGMDVEETAKVLGVSSRTVVKEWRAAKAWLHQRVC